MLSLGTHLNWLIERWTVYPRIGLTHGCKAGQLMRTVDREIARDSRGHSFLGLRSFGLSMLEMLHVPILKPWNFPAR